MTTVTYREIQEIAERNALDCLGAFHPEAEDHAPQGTGTIIMIGPGQAFWDRITASPEWRYGESDPVDRWSIRVLGQIAAELRADAIFPFGGPPYHPFQRWALRTGSCWASPVGFLVHERHGLMVSFRGALLMHERIALPEVPKEAPCRACEAPCRSACPVNALSPEAYDVSACLTQIDEQSPSDCASFGCSSRRACPVGQNLRNPAQSAYHMAAFIRSNTANTGDDA